MFIGLDWIPDLIQKDSLQFVNIIIIIIFTLSISVNNISINITIYEEWGTIKHVPLCAPMGHMGAPLFIDGDIDTDVVDTDA